jgi:hypothetical protein
LRFNPITIIIILIIFQGQSNKPMPKVPAIETKLKVTDEVIEPRPKLPAKIAIEIDPNKEIMDISGVPEEHQEVFFD